jgi:hypothetical protein
MKRKQQTRAKTEKITKQSVFPESRCDKHQGRKQTNEQKETDRRVKTQN